MRLPGYIAEHPSLRDERFHFYFRAERAYAGGKRGGPRVEAGGAKVPRMTNTGGAASAAFATTYATACV